MGGYTSKYADGEMRKAVGGGEEPKKKKKSTSKSRTVKKGTFGTESNPAGKYKYVEKRSGKTVSKTKTKSGRDKVVTYPDGSTKTVIKKKGQKRKVYKD